MKNIALYSFPGSDRVSKRELLAAMTLNALIQSGEFVRPSQAAVQIAVAWADALMEQLERSDCQSQ